MNGIQAVVFGSALVLLMGAAPAAYAGSDPPRALFVSVLQEPSVLESRQAIYDLIIFSKRTGVRTLFVQVYRGGRSWFPSGAADDGPYRECARRVGEDPFALLIERAHAEGIEVHAWLNLLSLSANERAPLLQQYGPGVLTRNLGEKRSLLEYKIDGQYFLEPGDPRVRDQLGTLVEEVVRAYPELDGVQFDYIRYPDWHPWYGYTDENVRRFREATGRTGTPAEEDPLWKDWRRDQVTELVELLARRARTIHSSIQVSTTGLVPYSRASMEAFQDWKRWVRSGLVDFVTLMCYARDAAQFDRYLQDAREQLGDLKKANIAVGAYELERSPGLFAKQFRMSEEAGSRASAVLHYGSLLERPALAGPLTRNRKLRSFAEGAVR